MKTALNWLREYVELPWNARTLAERLTAAGLEVEEIAEFGKIPDGVVVAEILTRGQHGNSDHLSVCQVSTGSGEPIQIVCGAPNCDAGQRVPLATIGTDFGDGFIIKKSKIRGVESNGMMCSARELGLNDDHDGLLILPHDTPLGIPLQHIIPSDCVIDWEVTPNRPDWLSHIGIAREIAAVAGSAIRLPEAPVRTLPGSNVSAAAKVTVEAPDLCPRYIARVFKNVRIAPSPDWLANRLKAVGLRPINNIVDITNYVMLEFGQPLHAFDLSNLAGQEIIVRRARPGEEIVTLDGSKLSLSTDHLLIADRDRGVALAGIMGGENSMITDQTCTVLLEAAAFDRSNIRITARTLGKATDSSYRFERGVSPETTALASARAASLICQLAGAEQLEGVLDVYDRPWQPETITGQPDQINALLGLDLTPEQIASFLARRGLGIAACAADAITIRTPYWRFDLHEPVDLAEEVAQMCGLDAIPENPATARIGGSFSEDQYYPIEQVRAQLLALGLDEVMNYSMWSLDQCLAGTALAPENILRVSNPISNDTACLRPSLIPGLLQVVNHNVSRNQHDLRLFEIGRVFVQELSGRRESTQIGIACSGRLHPERFGDERNQLCDFYSLKGILASWLENRGISGLVCQTAQHPACKPGATAAFCLGNRPIIQFGEATDALVKGFRLRAPLFLALIHLDDLLAAPTPDRVYRELPQFPGTARDISFVAPDTLHHQHILDGIASLKLPLLEKIDLTDIFADDKVLGPGRRSLTYSLTFRDSKRTLTDEEVNRLQDKVRSFLAAEFNLELR